MFSTSSTKKTADDSLFDVFNEKASEEAIESALHLKREREPERVEKSQENLPSAAKSLSKKVKLQEKKYEVVDAFEEEKSKEFVPAQYDAETGTKAENVESPVKINHQIRHEVSIPKDYNYTPIAEHKYLNPPNRSYPFELDPFQKVSVACIERNESVLVSAHTSAGKTVVAEYAVATALKNKQRVIYTSPIKALSNQKYRELLAEFGDVGLQTGDTTINPSASCLVMTTEILRSMMYRGSEHMREVSWVIFDEVHYMRDKERGVVWEESIILLPHKVRYVFLSATIPNAVEFSEWICQVHQQPCHVVYTDYRPVPLQHYIFPQGGDGIHLIVDEKSVFKEKNFAQAFSKLETKPQNQQKGPSKQQQKSQNSDLYKIVRMVWQRNYQPVIVFSFSKRECESNALQLSKLDFSSDDERTLITSVFKNAISCLGEDDRELPQIQHLLPLLQRGIGIHHSGLLPILKEVIEILFQEGLIKVLFATETFSIGLNMPAKTVVFTNIKKFDGSEQRMLSSGEYIQMSGRAGRRGLDDRGIVILMLSGGLDPDSVKNTMQGKSDALKSAFHQKYSMILNLLRIDGVEPEYMLQKSFYQFQNSASVPKLEAAIAEYEEEANEIKVMFEGKDVTCQMEEYYNVRKQLEQYRKDVRDVVHHPTYCLPFIQPGRLVKVEIDGSDYGWCVVVSFTKKMKKNSEDSKDTVTYIVSCLAHCERGAQDMVDSGLFPKPAKERGEMVVIPVTLDQMFGISTVRVYMQKDLRRTDSRQMMLKSQQEVLRRFENKIPILDPIADMNIRDDDFVKLMQKIEKLEGVLSKTLVSQRSDDPNIKQAYDAYCRRAEVETKIKDLKKKVKQVTSIIKLDELKQRMRVLRRLGFTTNSDVIELKGRVACEISAGDELVLTELIFNGAFTDLTPEQVVALLSCCVDTQERTSNEVVLKPHLEAPFKLLQETARRIAKISIESKIELNEEEYVQKFTSTMMPVAYDWACGAKFVDICKTSDIFEGSIIRALRRLEELLRQMIAGAKQIGNEDLENKFQEASAKIKRDIVFAASLYL